MSVKDTVKVGGYKLKNLILKVCVGWFVFSLFVMGYLFYTIESKEHKIGKLLYQIEEQKAQSELKNLKKKLKKKEKRYHELKKKYRDKLNALNSNQPSDSKNQSRPSTEKE